MEIFTVTKLIVLNISQLLKEDPLFHFNNMLEILTVESSNHISLWELIISNFSLSPFETFHYSLSKGEEAKFKTLNVVPVPVRAAGGHKLIAKLKFLDKLKLTFKCFLLHYTGNVSNKKRVLNRVCNK